MFGRSIDRNTTSTFVGRFEVGRWIQGLVTGRQHQQGMLGGEYIKKGLAEGIKK
jgi:hypothetical protein